MMMRIMMIMFLPRFRNWVPKILSTFLRWTIIYSDFNL